MKYGDGFVQHPDFYAHQFPPAPTRIHSRRGARSHAPGNLILMLVMKMMLWRWRCSRGEGGGGCGDVLHFCVTETIRRR
jgi:hypothetical protein